MRYDNLALIVNSTDNYSDLWPVFFSQFNKFFGFNLVDTYLSSEGLNIEFSEHYNDISDKNVNLVLTKKSTSWSERLIYTIEKINHDYLIILLDDYILIDAVNHELLKDAIDILNIDKDIGYINLVPSSNGIHYKLSDKFRLIPKKSPYRISLQAGLWRKDYLLEIIRRHESPWQFERFGSLRSNKSSRNVLASASRDAIINYHPAGGVVTNGLWNRQTSINLLTELGYTKLIPKRKIYSGQLDNKNKLVHRIIRSGNIKRVMDLIKSLI